VLRLFAAYRHAAEEDNAAVAFQVTQAGENRGMSTVQLRHMVDRECGGHILRLTCALWVYNCTSVPLALQETAMDDALRQDSEVKSNFHNVLPAMPGSLQKFAVSHDTPQRLPSTAVINHLQFNRVCGFGTLLRYWKHAFLYDMNTDSVCNCTKCKQELEGDVLHQACRPTALMQLHLYSH
jgi:hypothetical protein